MQDTSKKPGNWVLRFISGKYQGGEYQVAPDKQVIVGRSSDLDMVLVEDMVSRRHAKIALQGEAVWIEDLGSTNGTFVNGEKIKKAKLKEGDRLLIGTSILKLMTRESAAASPATTSGSSPPGGPATGAPQKNETRKGSTMSGSIEEIPLPDLLQLFGTSKKSGVLVLRTPNNDTGRIYLRKGNIYFCTINEQTDMGPLKSVYRLLTWEKGTFDLEGPDETKFDGEVDVGVQEVLMEGLRQLDEFNSVKEQLPPLDSAILLNTPFPKKLRDLSPEELDVFQLCLENETVDAVLNKSSLEDTQTGAALKALISGDYIRMDKP